MFENYLIDCCAPTLASLKSGSLFCCKCPPDSLVEESVAEWNAGFRDYGLSMCVLRRTATGALIYVYRRTSLARTLADPEVQAFLKALSENTKAEPVQPAMTAPSRFYCPEDGFSLQVPSASSLSGEE